MPFIDVKDYTFADEFVPIQKRSFCPIPASRSDCNPPETDKSSKYYNVWMPVPVKTGMVTIIAFLDLDQNISFLDGHELATFMGKNNTVRWNVAFIFYVWSTYD